MNSNVVKSATGERDTLALNGWFMLVVNLALIFGSAAWFFWMVTSNHQSPGPGLLILAPVLLCALGIFLMTGHFTLQPNESRVLILFGAYIGSVRHSGFWWANPLYSKTRGSQGRQSGTETGRAKAGGTTGSGLLSSKISLRMHNFNSEKLKVNDKRGNPIEIAAVIVWRVEDTARAAFDVEDFESYVHIQSESAIRHIASMYAYDHGEEHEPTLRESADEVAVALKKELLERLDKAGVVVEEARLTHLAYAPEIAQTMLRRQQAEAVIAARQTIVQNAVNMVDLALRQLSEKSVVKLDDERKAAMVSNLLVVLCGETEASPVINTGTLYS
ncbi:MAG TPA: SPFH domain-containing protein [Candidatus Acidoferrales bacterium]|jgi:regulator of protease activity HflC (stomatin/prohibitin superfamily)|nr:SPFH domain-containing protein [Candidatus Acidoferrales bacterium]